MHAAVLCPNRCGPQIDLFGVNQFFAESHFFGGVFMRREEPVMTREQPLMEREEPVMGS